MAIRFGCAASPRWYDESLDRLDAFVDALVGWGATSTELVLHPGHGDEVIARVHVLERDWTAVVERFQRRGIVCHTHAPLGPAFKLSRWASDREALQTAMRPVLRMLERVAGGQPVPPVFVVHAGPPVETAEFLAWASGETQGSAARLAVELRRPASGGASAFDRTRNSLAAFVHGLGDERTGICWDVAHDWEGGRHDAEWSIEPDPVFRQHVAHVHLHGAGVFEGRDDVHFPLQSGAIPWRAMLSPLVLGGYDGVMTVEARYRYARSLGDPWLELGGSFVLLDRWLRGEPSRIDGPPRVAATPHMRDATGANAD